MSADNANTAAAAASADIYSLAIVMQEILLRSLPYQTGNTASMLAKGNNHSVPGMADFWSLNRQVR